MNRTRQTQSRFVALRTSLKRSNSKQWQRQQLLSLRHCKIIRHSMLSPHYCRCAHTCTPAAATHTLTHVPVAQLLLHRDRGLVAAALSLLQRFHAATASAVLGLRRIQIVTLPVHEHVWARLQGLVPRVTQMVETDEDWLSSVGATMGRRMLHVLGLLEDMCFTQVSHAAAAVVPNTSLDTLWSMLQFGLPQQGYSRKHAVEDALLEIEDQQKQEDSGAGSALSTLNAKLRGSARRVVKGEGAGLGAGAGADTEAQEGAAEAQTESEGKEAAADKTPKRARGRSWRSRRHKSTASMEEQLYGARWRASALAGDVIDPERQTFLRNLGIGERVIDLIKDVGDVWESRTAAGVATIEFKVAMVRLVGAAYRMLSVYARRHEENQQHMELHLSLMRQHMRRGWMSPFVMADVLRDNLPLSRKTELVTKVLEDSLFLIRTHGRRPQFLAPLHAVVVHKDREQGHMQRMVTQVLWLPSHLHQRLSHCHVLVSSVAA